MEDQIPIRGRSRFHSAKLVSYYHRLQHGIFNVVIDHILSELNNRFFERSIQLLRRVACLDPWDSFANFEVEKLIELAKIYVDDFSDYDCFRLLGELPIFIDEVRNDNDFSTCIDLGNLSEKMVQTDIYTHFLLVCHLIELALTIIKTERRNKINDDWMNISMINIEQDLFASVEDENILQRFQNLSNHIINLPHKARGMNGAYCICSFEFIMLSYFFEEL
jgi:hypothetical protein